MHTPTPWETRQAKHKVDGAYDWAIGARPEGSAPYCIGEMVGRASETLWLPAAENAAHAIACVNAFHDDQGRTLEDIPQGLVWRLVDALQTADEAINPRDTKALSMHEWNKRLRAATAEIRALLDSLHIKEPRDDN